MGQKTSMTWPPRPMSPTASPSLPTSTTSYSPHLLYPECHSLLPPSPPRSVLPSQFMWRSTQRLCLRSLCLAHLLREVCTARQVRGRPTQAGGSSASFRLVYQPAPCGSPGGVVPEPRRGGSRAQLTQVFLFGGSY